jgi:hypothetical protein
VHILARSAQPTGLGGEDGFVTRWRFLELPVLAAPLRSDALRIRLSAPGSIASTAPVAFDSEPLVHSLERASGSSLVLPNLLSYVPCAKLPRLRDGTAEVPNRIVGFQYTWPVGNGTTPFEGVLDLYRLDRLPVTSASGVDTGVGTYEVDRRLLGAALAAPDSPP